MRSSKGSKKGPAAVHAELDADGPGQKKLHKRTLIVAGIPVNVFSDPEVERKHKPVVIAFVLHGRTGSAKRMDPYVTAIFDEVRGRRSALGGDKAQDLMVVTIDQRNHGKRMVEERTNLGWFDDPEKNNERHAIDMYAIQTGTAHDVSYLIDFLPSYLYPNGERTISQWVCLGKSLGGHSTWILLRNEPRVKIGIPIIGERACPDYLKLMTRRTKGHKLPFGPPFIPDSLLELIKRVDPAASPCAASDESNPFLGKKILVMSGREDKIAPWAAAEEFVERLNVGEHGVKEVIIEPGVGHDMSEAMTKEAARFIWQHALAV